MGDLQGDKTKPEPTKPLSRFLGDWCPGTGPKERGGTSERSAGSAKPPGLLLAGAQGGGKALGGLVEAYWRPCRGGTRAGLLRAACRSACAWCNPGEAEGRPVGVPRLFRGI